MNGGSVHSHVHAVSACQLNHVFFSTYTYDVEIEAWVPVRPLPVPPCDVVALQNPNGARITRPVGSRTAILLWCDRHDTSFWVYLDETGGDE